MRNENKRLLLKQEISELERENKKLRDKNEALQWQIKCFEEDKKAILFSQEKLQEKEKYLDDAIQEYKEIIGELRRIRDDYVHAIRSAVDLKNSYSEKIRMELKRIKKQEKKQER